MFKLSRASLLAIGFFALFHAGAAFGSSEQEPVSLKNEDTHMTETCPMWSGSPIKRTVVAGDELLLSFAADHWVRNARYELWVHADTQGRKVTLLSATLEPAENNADRCWTNKEIRLDQFAGQTVTIYFSSAAVDRKRGEPRPLREDELRVSARIGNSRAGPDDYNVILLSIDTLRPDHLGYSGYKRQTSPNLDRLSKSAVVFTEAISDAPWTLPAHASAMTGVYPRAHGLVVPLAVDSGAKSFPPSVKPVAEILAENGYRTVAFTGGGYVSAHFGFSRGFDNYFEFSDLFQGDSIFNFASAEKWIEGHSKQKFFMFLHTFDVHGPYSFDSLLLGKSSLKLKERINEQYDSGILAVDARVGALVAKLKELKLDRKTILIVMSDHGEELFEKGFALQHGHTLYDDQIRIALMFYCPTLWTPRRIDRFQAQHIDIVPTLMDVLKIRRHPAFHGHSLNALLKGGDVPKESVAITEALEYGGRDSYSVRLVGAGRHQLIFSPSWEKRNMDAGDRQNYYWLSRVNKEHGVEFYDLDHDPLVRENLANKDLDGLEHAKTILEAFFQKVKPMSAPSAEDPKTSISEDLKERLKALGY